MTRVNPLVGCFFAWWFLLKSFLYLTHIFVVCCSINIEYFQDITTFSKVILTESCVVVFC